MNTAANPIPSADSGRAAAAPVELPDPVSLQILVKALAASAAAVATSRFGAQLAAVSAVVATLVADAVKDVAKRRRWGRKRLAALTGLLLLFSSVIGSVSICSFTAGSSGARDTTCFTRTVAGSEPTRASGSGSAFASDDAAGKSGTAVRHSWAPTRACGAATVPGCAPAEQHRSSVDRRACASRRDASGPARSVERQ